MSFFYDCVNNNMSEFDYLLKFIVVGDTGTKGEIKASAKVAWSCSSWNRK